MSMKKRFDEFIALPNGTKVCNHNWCECVAIANSYQEYVKGLGFVPVQVAHQWWNNFWAYPNAYNHYTASQRAVVGSLVVWNEYWGAGAGHIGYVTKVESNGTFYTMEQNAGTGSQRWLWRYHRNMSGVLGFLVPKVNPAKLRAPAPQRPLKPSVQRTTKGVEVIRRSKPTTASAAKTPPLTPNTTANFTAWMRGESVAGNNVWFQGISGDWFWSGAFTQTRTDGMKDLNPPAPSKPKPKTGERQAKGLNVNVRRAPELNSGVAGEVKASSIVKVDGWIKGDTYDKINVWFKITGGYAWAGAFTNSSTTGLKDLAPPGTPPKDPKPPITPPEPNPNVPKVVGPGPVLEEIENWDEPAPDFGFTLPRHGIKEHGLILPDWIVQRTVLPIGGYYEGRPGRANHIVLHHAVSKYLDGAVDTLSGPSYPTSTGVIKDNEMVNMVPSQDTPSTNGRWKSNQWSTTWELCNDKTNTDKPSAETHETAAWACALDALEQGMQLPLALGVTVFGHSSVSKSATACPGEVDMEWITERANEIIGSLVADEPIPAPNYDDLSESIKGLTGLINSLIALLKSIFRVKE